MAAVMRAKAELRNLLGDAQGGQAASGEPSRKRPQSKRRTGKRQEDWARVDFFGDARQTFIVRGDLYITIGESELRASSQKEES